MNTIDPNLFWSRVDEILASKKMTLKMLSSKANIEYRLFNNQRTRGALPKVEQLNAMAISLGTTIEFLITGEHVKGWLPTRINTIANACLSASEIDLQLVERVLRIDNKQLT